ncbi:MAG: sulfatase-like hydrolase/transferase [Chromatiales bacterium]|jgi:glucan phosphoethanolaminetransferase (alkaline phosphatase superfamily)
MSASNLRKTIAVGSVAILVLLELGMFSDFFSPFRFLWNQGRIIELFLSLILFCWTLLGTFLIFFSKRSLLRKITLPIFLFFFLFNIGSFSAANSPLDFQQSVLIVSYFQWWFWEVVENFGLASLPFLLILVPVILFVERLPDIVKLNISKNFYFVPISAVILTPIGLQYSHGQFDRYPSFFRIPSMLVYASQSQVYDGERSKASYESPLDAQVEKIILIVDESIRADILGINGFEKDTTPYLDSLKSGIVNFGLAASASNCSHYSNLILRTGARKEDIPDNQQMTLKQPSIWQFTRKAGFHNVYLDAQSAEEWANYQNFMNAHEASSVDEIIRVRQETAYESDTVAREKLIELLKQPGKTFIMLNKYGIHFPYFRSYPEEYDIFSPALEPGEPMNDREKSLNSFMNGIRWSVDDWFKGLLAETGELQSYVIIYTSDHGQNIVDDGTLATHCRPQANRFEGMVPMMVFSNDAAVLERFKAVQMASYDKTSHFQIFPTLISLAGYKATWVKSHYGATLSDLPATPPEFFVGDIHGRGSVRQWVSIFLDGTKSDQDLPVVHAPD